MARLAHMIRDIVIEAFAEQKVSPLLKDLREAFAHTLLPDIDHSSKTPEFADMYAQTIAYGLFAACCNHADPNVKLRRLGAAREIPKTNPFLRKLFATITGPDLDDEPYAGSVDDLAQLLADADMDGILADFGKREGREDPVVHFYETFLAAYDPQLRETRGVYYTPEPVVSYIVRSIDHLLKTKFGCSGGLADTTTITLNRQTTDGSETKTVQESVPKVLILDPACGTGTFLYTVTDHIRRNFMKQGNAGMWSGFVKQHILRRLFGFELLMAPYAVAHFNLGMQLAGQDLPSEELSRTWSYDFASEERLGIYLTNTLEEAEKQAEQLVGLFRTISEEADAAAVIKKDLPIMVVLGNPPYSGHSANRSEVMKRVAPGNEYVVQTKKGPKKKVATKEIFLKEKTLIGKLLQDYYRVDGKPLGERNPKWLQDDYVKFLRWGSWRIERTGAGILGFITNHGYLDNPTFRGMRQQLMQTFDEIYIIDLHGNSKKKERCPDGSKDENVFDIQQGVAICLLVKLPKVEK